MSAYPFPRSAPAAASPSPPSPVPSHPQPRSAEMRPPRLLQAAKDHLRRPAVHARISGAKSLFAATKDYLAQTDYRAAYADVSGRLRSAVGAAREYAGQTLAAQGPGAAGESEGWVGRRRQSWDEWARDRRRRRQEEQRGTERVWLFPGWAIRRPAPTSARAYANSGVHDDGGPFALELKVAGYCTSLRPPEQATRAQRAFMRLARSFAALPRLQPGPAGTGTGTGSGSNSESASLRSYEEGIGGGTPPGSGAGSPLMSPLLRAVITEEPAEDIDLINLDSPSGSGSGSGTSTPREREEG
ncbi:hypothetical protein CALCODRAFT_484895, partial [Calocera cornea HHB12733]